VSAIQAAWVAADLRELGIPAETVAGDYGEFTVLVDNAALVSGGPLAFLGILPTKRRVREAVAQHLDLASGKRAKSGADA
jgi:hypothetical protein